MTYSLLPRNRINLRVFEVDRRFERHGDDFVFYDFEKGMESFGSQIEQDIHKNSYVTYCVSLYTASMLYNILYN